MANEFNVVESGLIQCACGGKVTLTSTVQGYVIGGKKPLYWKDLLNAAVACPRGKNKCTKVVAISSAGTEMNVGAKGEPYLLRTDGFKTDKGRAVILVNPGQFQSKISSVPSTENQVIKEEEPTEQTVKEAEELLHKEKYALYFLRKSEDLYQPLRPTRAFRKADEKYVTKNDPLDIKDNIYVHTFAYLYIKQNGKIKEYKVLSRGSLYNEQLGDIYFEDTNSKIKYNYIPIYEDSIMDISYSSFALKDEGDIKKLKRLSVNPKEPNNKDSFYFKELKGIDKSDINEEDLTTQKKFTPNKEGKQKRLNILCIIDDILGEIEDMYERYYTNYKLAFAQNHSIIEDIKKRNSYTYTIANMVDYFYFSKDEEKKYKDSILELKKIYNKMVSLILSDYDLVDFLVKDVDISKILDKDKDNVAQSYFQQLQFLKKDFFNKELKGEEKDKELKEAHYSKTNFRTSDKFIRIKYAYLTDSIKKTNRRYVSSMSRLGIKSLQFNTSNDNYTKIKDNASYVLAHVLFALLYSHEFEDDLKSMTIFSTINTLRNDFLLKLKVIAPKPNISDNAIKDMKDIVEKQEIYHDMIVKPLGHRDKFLEEYENLDYVKSIKSFEQKGDNVSFKSKYIYYENESFYKGIVEKPKDIIKKIAIKLEDTKLKELLKIYGEINVEDKLSYIASCMNIVYLLSAPRTNLDEETDINSFFNENLNHIYNFVVNFTKERIALNDKEKDTLNLEYQISYTYSLMQMKLILNDVIFSNSKKKALKFIKTFKVAVNTDSKTDLNYKYIHEQAQDTKSLTREYYETFKNIEGITSELDKILEKIKDEAPERRTISQNITTHLSSGLKVYSNLIAIAKVADYLYFDDNNKDIKSHIGFVKDLTDATVGIALLISKHPNTPIKVLKQLVNDTRVSNISNSSKRLLSFTQEKVVTKVAVIALIVTTSYDVVKLAQRKDYDALALTVCVSGINLVLLLTTPAMPAVVTGAILTIVSGIILSEILDSDLDIYLKKSLLYRTIDFSIWKNLRGIAQSKKYQAPYLFETTNKNKELKAISNDGFNNPKRLINFIGENYKGNERYFDTSLKNELSFFNSSLFGYKLELLGRRRERKLKNHYGLDTQIWQDTFVKIPSVLYTDKTSKFIFNANDNYYLLDKDNINLFIKEENYYVFDLLDQNFKTLLELNTINHKKASIIVLSSQVELKYEFMYDYREIVYLDAVNFEQVSFTPQDVEELKQIIEKKEEK